MPCTNGNCQRSTSTLSCAPSILISHLKFALCSSMNTTDSAIDLSALKADSRSPPWFQSRDLDEMLHRIRKFWRSHECDSSFCGATKFSYCRFLAVPTRSTNNKNYSESTELSRQLGFLLIAGEQDSWTLAALKQKENKKRTLKQPYFRTKIFSKKVFDSKSFI